MYISTLVAAPRAHSGAESVRLPTGLVVRVATPADIPGLAHMLASLSSRSRALRYFTPRPLTGETALREAARIAGGPPEQHMALIAADVVEGAHTVVAVAELARDGTTATGELGIVVRDDYQARGIGSHLLGRLLELASLMGIHQLRCELLADNRAMLRLIRRAGTQAAVTQSAGQLQILVSVPGVELSQA